MTTFIWCIDIDWEHDVFPRIDISEISKSPISLELPQLEMSRSIDNNNPLQLPGDNFVTKEHTQEEYFFYLSDKQTDQLMLSNSRRSIDTYNTTTIIIVL